MSLLPRESAEPPRTAPEEAAIHEVSAADLVRRALPHVRSFLVDSAIDTVAKRGLALAEAEIVLPAALALGSAQAMIGSPPPAGEVIGHIREHRLIAAASSVGRYACTHTHELLEKKNVFGRTLSIMGGRPADAAMSGARWGIRRLLRQDAQD